MIPRSGYKKLIEGSSRAGSWRMKEEGVEGMLENGTNSDFSDFLIDYCIMGIHLLYSLHSQFLCFIIVTFLFYETIAIKSETVSLYDDDEMITYNITGRIVNGTKAVVSQFPHQVSLRRTWSGSHFCGGSVISEKFVLTAAHCMFLNKVFIKPWTILVVGGEMQLDRTTKTGQRRGVREILLHQKFDQKTYENDIALLELKVPFEFTAQLSPISLPKDQVPPGTICQVSGWGYPEENIPSVSNDLMYVDLPILSMEDCRNLLVEVTNLPPGMYCAGYIEGLRDACQGDSGGGMVCNGVIMGVVSAGEGCARPKLPGIYTDVLYYKHWITYPLAYKISDYTDYDKNRAVNKAHSISFTIVSLCSLYLLKLLLLQ
ncbi:trypsin-2-like [Vespula squamosa]|uniref:Trypsin-2-like n=1 Tax=Vespula squamosa TaxID=30214 RepID=A0ABD2AKH4_VESSQ